MSLEIYACKCEQRKLCARCLAREHTTPGRCAVSGCPYKRFSGIIHCGQHADLRMPRCHILLGGCVREEIFENEVDGASSLYDADCACVDLPEGVCESCIRKQKWKSIHICEKQNCDKKRFGLNPVCEAHFEDFVKALNDEYLEIVAECDSCMQRPPFVVRGDLNICVECAKF